MRRMRDVKLSPPRFLLVCLALTAACTASSSDGAETAGHAGTSSGTSGSAGHSGASAGGRNGGQAGTAGSGSSSAGSSGTSSGGGAGHAGTSGSGGNAGSSSAMDAAVPDASGGNGGAGGDSGPKTSTTLAQRVCPKGASFGNPLPGDSPMAQPVQGGFGFLEGPVWLADKGWLLFSDMDMSSNTPNGPKSRIRRLKPPNTFDVFVEQANSNGLALDVDGAVLACTHDMQTLSRYLPDSGMREARALTYMGKHFNSPNDLTVRSDGMVYFTDPDWQLAGRTNETMMTGVYRVTSDDTVELVDGTLNKPNGITLSLDEHTLYVGSSAPEIRAYPVNADGSVGASTVFASPGGSDGMAIDCAGNLYVAGGNDVKVFAANGNSLGSIAVAGTTSNVAFGGTDAKTLYITAGNTLYSIALQVPGLPY
jgi:gluconolactonase